MLLKIGSCSFSALSNPELCYRAWLWEYLFALRVPVAFRGDVACSLASFYARLNVFKARMIGDSRCSGQPIDQKDALQADLSLHHLDNPPGDLWKECLSDCGQIPDRVQARLLPLPTRGGHVSSHLDLLMYHGISGTSCASCNLLVSGHVPRPANQKYNTIDLLHEWSPMVLISQRHAGKPHSLSFPRPRLSSPGTELDLLDEQANSLNCVIIRSAGGS